VSARDRCCTRKDTASASEALPGCHHHQPGRSRRIGPRPQHVPHPVLQQEGFDGAADDYDWIGFDPRGVGSSIPTISCDPNYLGPDRPNYVPWTPSLLNTWEARSEGYASACASQNAEQTELLHNMTTVDNAKDVNSIRKALGVSQITYYGFSWGTDLGQTYATLFPKTLRRLILDSNVNMTRPGFDDFNLD
jgi:pimeloyl-ACP methyl ester carboxylesterase